MKIEVIEIDGKLKYLLPMKLLEKIRLRVFMTPPDFVKKLNISLRSYYRLLENPCTNHVKTADAINQFLKTLKGADNYGEKKWLK